MLPHNIDVTLAKLMFLNLVVLNYSSVKVRSGYLTTNLTKTWVSLPVKIQIDLN